jgi:hypothetical protein
MSRIAHQPKILNRRAVGKPEGTEGNNALTNAADDAPIAPCIPRKGAGRSGFGMNDRVWREVKE